MEFIIKAILGGLIVAGVVTAAERGNPTLGALILGIPLGTIISMVFMYFGGVDIQIFQQLAKETVYFVLVSLMFFPVFVYGLYYFNFWISIGSAITVTMICLLILKYYLENLVTPLFTPIFTNLLFQISQMNKGAFTSLFLPQ